MGQNIVQKIVAAHLLSGGGASGQMTIRVDHTIWSDSTGMMAGQLLESIGAERVKPELNVIYADHNTLQISAEYTDDQMYEKTAAARFGMVYSKSGNGIMHSLHCQRFAMPGKVLVGADSHTVTGGALGMLAIGAGGLAVGQALVTAEFKLNPPHVIKVEFIGALSPGVSAKDAALYIMRELTVKGGLGFILEYGGSGAENLSVAQRMTISNMSVETGATAGVWPSDEQTRLFLRAQRREADWTELIADEAAEYEKVITVNLSELEPLVALPHMPDNVCPVRDVERLKVDTVVIGTCNSGSYSDIAQAASILRGKRINKDIELTVAPNSRQTLQQLSEDGIITELVKSGARILECFCGPCLGGGQVPPKNGVTVRTTNRNFRGRCGNYTAGIYMVSAETAAATALTGYLTDARDVSELTALAQCAEPTEYPINDDYIIWPERPEGDPGVRLHKGDHIADLPVHEPIKGDLTAVVSIKLGDDITTDDIIPMGNYNQKWISNIPRLAQWCFQNIDEGFVERSLNLGKTVIVGGANYGQGSSREQAAQCPMYLGVEAILAVSIARIHRENLINYGILPLIFDDRADAELITQGDRLVIKSVPSGVEDGRFTLDLPDKGLSISAHIDVSDYERTVLKCGGLQNYLRQYARLDRSSNE